jgi:hypothetical protein
LARAAKNTRKRRKRARAHRLAWQFSPPRTDLVGQYERKFPEIFQSLTEPAKTALATILTDVQNFNFIAGGRAPAFSRTFRVRLNRFLAHARELKRWYDYEEVHPRGLSDELMALFHFVDTNIAPYFASGGPPCDVYVPPSLRPFSVPIPRNLRRLTTTEVRRRLIDPPTADYALLEFFREVVRLGLGPELNQKQIAENIVRLTGKHRSATAVIMSVARFSRSPIRVKKATHIRSEVRRLLEVRS